MIKIIAWVRTVTEVRVSCFPPVTEERFVPSAESYSSLLAYCSKCMEVYCII
jgi:hypothetical protein